MHRLAYNGDGATLRAAAACSTRMTQIWALYRQSGSDRLEKQPTDLRRHHHYMRDDAGVRLPVGLDSQ